MTATVYSRTPTVLNAAHTPMVSSSPLLDLNVVSKVYVSNRSGLIRPIMDPEFTVERTESVASSYDQLFISVTLCGKINWLLWLIRFHLLNTSAKEMVALFKLLMVASSEAMRICDSISAPSNAIAVPS
ncbi:hypothetical protein D3C85_1495300 [compost metagenome]